VAVDLARHLRSVCLLVQHNSSRFRRKPAISEYPHASSAMHLAQLQRLERLESVNDIHEHLNGKLKKMPDKRRTGEKPSCSQRKDAAVTVLVRSSFMSTSAAGPPSRSRTWQCTAAGCNAQSPCACRPVIGCEPTIKRRAGNPASADGFQQRQPWGRAGHASEMCSFERCLSKDDRRGCLSRIAP